MNGVFCIRYIDLEKINCPVIKNMSSLVCFSLFDIVICQSARSLETIESSSITMLLRLWFFYRSEKGFPIECHHFV